LPSKAHLLIVDDEANTLASLSRAFRLAGHEASICDNAARALELAKAEKFDLILSDVVMPGKDGLTLLEELKRTQNNMTMAAKTLGLERSHLYKKAEQLGIDVRALRRDQGATE
jgi:DNA-binding NtrC family response regulator